MAGQDGISRESIKSVPQVYFDIVARLIPGIAIIGSILVVIAGPESSWSNLQSWLGESSGFSITTMTALILLLSYIFAILLWCAWSSLAAVICGEKYWDSEPFRWKYENIKYKNAVAGDRVTKLNAQVHMGETLSAGFILCSLIGFGVYFFHSSDLPRFVSSVLLFFAALSSWNATIYFVRHMKATVDNNFSILMSQKGRLSERLVLLFDFDGTLVELDKLEAYQKVVDNYGLYPQSDLVKALHKLDNELCAKGEYDRRKVFEQYANKFKSGIDTGKLCRLFWKAVTDTQNIKPCCLETLDILENEDHILACVTDSDGFGGNKLERIQATGLDRYFGKRVFIGGDKGRPRKGCAEYMEWVIRDLALDFTRWVMVGDKTEIDLVPARAIGMETVLVKNDEYPGVWQREVKSLHELLPIIRRLKPTGQTTT